MSSTSQFILQVLLYTSTIFGVMYLSADNGEKQLFDQFAVSLDGVMLPVSSTDNAQKFYNDVLDLPSIVAEEDPNKIVGFRVSGGKKIIFEENSKSSQVQLVIRVRNGFRSLYESFSTKIKSSKIKDTHAVLSPLMTQTWGEEFVITDNDKNQLIFLSPKRRSRGRY
jgi:hypothetical protein